MKIHDLAFIHPELKVGEVFFTNSNLSNFEKMEFRTKRLGKLTYNGIGEKQLLEDWYPVFLSDLEVTNSRFSLKALRRKYWN